MFNYLIYQLTLIITCFYNLLNSDFIYKIKKKSNNIFVFFPTNFSDFINYFARAYILHDIILLIWMSKSLKNFKIVSVNKINSLKNKSIFYNFYDRYNPQRLENKSVQIKTKLKSIESKNNKFFPPIYYLNLWEDKIQMHKIFNDLKITTPKTKIFNSYNRKKIKNLNLKFPLLFKHPFLNQSKGLKKIDSKNDLINHIENNKLNEFLLQEIVDMTSDIRIVLVDYKIVYHYWRSKKKTKSFTTTSTTNNSTLRLDPIPEKTKKIIIRYTKKLKLKLAAYDVTYDNDNLNSNPKVLEVSSSFLLNPIPKGKYLKMPYTKFKAKPIKFAKSRFYEFRNLKFKFYDSLLK